jgi:drug/metabolite transporter (DMT)-like permease
MNTSVAYVLRRGVNARAGSIAIVVDACAFALPLGLIALAAGGDWSWTSMGRFALVGLVSPGLAMITYTHAIDMVGASRVGIMIGAAPVLSAALAITFLGEPARAIVLSATALIVAGSILLAWDPARPLGYRSVGLLLGALTSGCFAVQANLTRWASERKDTDQLLGVAVIITSGTLVMAVYWLLQRRSTPVPVNATALLSFLPTGALFAAAYVCFVNAYERGRVIVVSPLTAAEALWTVLFVMLLVGRAKDGLGRRVLLACVLVTAGTTVVATFH